MASILEQFDEATRARDRYRDLADRSDWLREAWLLRLREDGMTIRAIADLVDIPHTTVHRMIKRASVRYAIAEQLR